ncbi:hypothetical protein ACCT30_51740, partial [Rhizobium ruizarguesonis]
FICINVQDPLLPAVPVDDFVDPDEFLVYPHCDTRPIDQLTAYIESMGGHSLRSVMIDMYSPHPVLERVATGLAYVLEN